MKKHAKTRNVINIFFFVVIVTLLSACGLTNHFENQGDIVLPAISDDMKQRDLDVLKTCCTPNLAESVINLFDTAYQIGKVSSPEISSAKLERNIQYTDKGKSYCSDFVSLSLENGEQLWVLVEGEQAFAIYDGLSDGELRIGIVE